MKNQARRQEEPEESGTSEPDAPETLRFPPRERPGTQRRTPQEEPFDLERDERDRDAHLQERAQKDLEAERIRDKADRTKAILEARAALSENRKAGHLDAMVWDAREAIQTSLTEDSEERPNYVPIASSPKIIPDANRPAPPGSVYVAPYNLPEYSPAPKATFLDVVRRCASTLAAAAFVVVGYMTVTGTLSLSPEFTRHQASLAPLLVAAFAWPVLGLIMTASAVHSWFPDQRSARRQRGTGLATLVVSCAGIGWILAAANGLAWVALIAALALMAGAGYGVHALNLLTARSPRERWLTDAPLELALGWGAFTFCWSASALLAGLQINSGPPALLGTIFLIAALVPVFIAGSSERGRILPSAGLAFGVAWLIPAAILTGQVLLMVLAIVGTLAAFLAALSRRQAITSAERKA
ncbi:hypothetical protein [Galactobacter sp.]|uniref:hypothetical protein n=1 Tax=Galactobacter sp. TaxID=2676125 RepID=UPI0025B930B8|nr:hypothetical protein [Galactobacter sp.]